MHPLLLDIVHPSRFAKLIPYPRTRAAKIQALQKVCSLLQKIEDTYPTSAYQLKATIAPNPDASTPSYNVMTAVISMPLLTPFSGTIYAYNWAHEHAHHEQGCRDNPVCNYEFAQISQVFYPAHTTTPILMRLTPEYIGNYREMIARTASARLLANAYTELSQRYDFTMADREILLKEYTRISTELHTCERDFSLNAMKRYNEKMLRRYRDDDVVVLNMTAKDVRQFLEDNGDYLYTQALNRFQRAIRDLASAKISLYADTHERREETTERQRQLAIQHERDIERALTRQTESKTLPLTTYEIVDDNMQGHDEHDIFDDNLDER